MKKIILYIILLIIIFISTSVYAASKIDNIQIGMKLTDLFKIISKDKMTVQGGQYLFKEKVGNLDGKWCFDIKDKKIDWFQYSYYPPDFKNNYSKKTYDFLLKETESIIKDLTVVYGKPKTISKTVPYKDPFKKYPVYSHEVKSALWITPQKGIKVEFYFFGGKGEYWMSVQIHVNRKDYEYF